MAIIALYAPNPNDGTTTFDKVRFYEADDSSGTNASLLTTEDISTTYRAEIDPGYTSYTYTSGDTAKYYAAKWYNSSNGNISDYTDWVLGGKDRWDSMFENELSDTANAVWSQSDIARFKKNALNALYPDVFRKVIDTSLTLDNDSAPSYTYSVPFGIFNISEVGVGDIDNQTSTFKTLHNDNWMFENGTLHLYNIPTSEDSATIRLIAHKKFLEVGEVPEMFGEFILFHLKMQAYLQMADDYPRFLEWGRLQEGTRVSFENLRVQAREYERKFLQGRADARSMLHPSHV